LPHDPGHKELLEIASFAWTKNRVTVTEVVFLEGSTESIKTPLLFLGQSWITRA
jgi:hypothetical protein